MLVLLTLRPRSSLADGNVGQGEAIIQKILVSKFTTTTAPTEADVAWTFIRNDHFSMKAARGLSDGTVVGLMWSDVPPARQASLMYLTATGSVTWGPLGFGTNHGEGTDVRRCQTHGIECNTIRPCT